MLAKKVVPDCQTLLEVCQNYVVEPSSAIDKLAEGDHRTP